MWPNAGLGQFGYGGMDEEEHRMEERLQGDVIQTVLIKNEQGFGFTIVGGDQRGDVLRIKSIVPGSVSDRDGRLAVGDVIVRINGQSVLSFTHQEVVDLFHNLPLHSRVKIEARRSIGRNGRGFDNGGEVPPYLPQERDSSQGMERNNDLQRNISKWNLLCLCNSVIWMITSRYCKYVCMCVIIIVGTYLVYWLHTYCMVP